MHYVAKNVVKTVTFCFMINRIASVCFPLTFNHAYIFTFYRFRNNLFDSKGHLSLVRLYAFTLLFHFNLNFFYFLFNKKIVFLFLMNNCHF